MIGIRRFELALICFAALSTIAAKKPDRTGTQRAAELAMQAVRLYKVGQHAKAAELFLEAYDISKRPTQLRNAAKALEEAGSLDRSMELWARYRDDKGVNEDEKAEAVAHLKLIEEKKKNVQITHAAEEARNAAEAAAAAADEARLQAQEAQKQATIASNDNSNNNTRVQTQVDQGPPVASYVLIGIGAVTALTGGALYLVSSSQVSSLDDKIGMTDGNGRIVGITPGEVDSKVSSINTTRIVSGVLVSAGIVALGSGVTWLLLDDGSTSVAIVPGPASVGVFGKF